MTQGARPSETITFPRGGEPEFYDSLYASFPSDALVLAEGVSDRDNRLASNLSYQRLAKVLGLEQQPILLPSQQPEIAEAGEESRDGGFPLDVDEGAISTEVRTAKVSPDVVYADADLADFSETTIDFLNEVAVIYDSRNIEEVLERFQVFEEKFTDEDVEAVYEDIIFKRNERLISALDANLNRYDTIVIPWGAMHMPDLEMKLFEREFKQMSERALPLVRYQTVLTQLRSAIEAA